MALICLNKNTEILKGKGKSERTAPGAGGRPYFHAGIFSEGYAPGTSSVRRSSGVESANIAWVSSPARAASRAERV